MPLPDGTLDVVVAMQVYEYVPDVERALVEAYRVLQPGGRLVIIDSDFDTMIVHTDAPDLTARVIRTFDEHFAHRTLPASCVDCCSRLASRKQQSSPCPF